MNLKPLVSIIIPCFNAEKYLETALQSALNQTYPHLEVIAIDDGSTDSSLGILRKYQETGEITVLTHPNNENRGVGYTRRLGINYSNGEYIAFLDADDYFDLHKLETQIELLEKHPKSILCHTGIVLIKDAHTQNDFENWFNWHKEVNEYRLCESAYFLNANFICNSSVVVKSEILKKTSFESKQLFQFEDWVTWSLVSEHGFFLFTPQPLTYYRFHSNSATSSVIKNELVNLYSYLEFYLTLLSKTSSTKISQTCLDQTYPLLNQICNQYATCTGGTLHTPSKPFAETGDLQLEKHKLLTEVTQMQSQLECMSTQLADKETSFSEQGQRIASQEQQIAELNHQVACSDKVLQEVLNSLSWKLTAPLRLGLSFLVSCNNATVVPVSQSIKRSAKFLCFAISQMKTYYRDHGHLPKLSELPTRIKSTTAAFLNAQTQRQMQALTSTKVGTDDKGSTDVVATPSEGSHGKNGCKTSVRRT